MKTVLNIVTTVLIILFLGYQFYLKSSVNKCETNKESKCSTENKSNECKWNTENIDVTVVVSSDSTVNIDSLLDEFQETIIGQEIEIDSGSAIINKGIIVINEENDTTE